MVGLGVFYSMWAVVLPTYWGRCKKHAALFGDPNLKAAHLFAPRCHKALCPRGLGKHWLSDGSRPGKPGKLRAKCADSSCEEGSGWKNLEACSRLEAKFAGPRTPRARWTIPSSTATRTASEREEKGGGGGGTRACLCRSGSSTPAGRSSSWWVPSALGSRPALSIPCRIACSRRSYSSMRESRWLRLVRSDATNCAFLRLRFDTVVLGSRKTFEQSGGKEEPESLLKRKATGISCPQLHGLFLPAPRAQVWTAEMLECGLTLLASG